MKEEEKKRVRRSARALRSAQRLIKEAQTQCRQAVLLAGDLYRCAGLVDEIYYELEDQNERIQLLVDRAGEALRGKEERE